ncbi:MAG: ABC transporter permease [Ignavibacteriae bacterium]|nr:ABC transporter permease [Ignavibacteriota bacterium]
MNKAFVVAKWEYIEKVKSKAFLVGLFLTPMIMVGMGVLPGLLAGKEDESPKVIGVIDASGELDSALAARMSKYTLSNGQPNYLVRPIASGKSGDLAAESAEADRSILHDDIEGYIVLGPHAMRDSVFEYHAKSGGDLRLIGRFEENLRNIISERKFVSHGLDPKLMRELRTQVDVRMVKISKEGKKEETSFLKTFFSAYVFVMALFFLIMTSGQLLVRGVLEEKSNRIIEVLVSSCTPSQLMTGKVLGLSALGLTQMGFWALIALASTAKFGTAEFPPPQQLLLMLVYFILGYLLYAAVFLAVGSPVTTEQEAQQLNGYLVMLLILPIALVVPVMQHPNALWVKVLTYFPLLTPTLMALRIPVQMPSTGEIVATILVLIASSYFMMIAAGRIFRIAILSTGKKPSLAQLARWATRG